MNSSFSNSNSNSKPHFFKPRKRFNKGRRPDFRFERAEDNRNREPSPEALAALEPSAFDVFNLPKTLLFSINKMGFKDPTEIQKLAISPAIEGRDIIACAQTGSGKTAAFGIPLVTALIKDPEAMAIVLAPTRELAEQISTVFKDLTQSQNNMRVALLIGGTSMMPQLRNLSKNPRIIVGTPGRICDHLNRKSLSLSKAKLFVLDECDRMLDMGFAPQIAEVMKFLPSVRQTLLFSATLPPAAEKMIVNQMKSPMKIGAEVAATTPDQITQTTVRVGSKEKNISLLKEIEARQGSMIIFTRTKSRADRLADFLDDSGISIQVIHGDRSQSQRLRALRDFREQRARILVATDIAARGIDVPHIQTVINYDLPQCAEDFVHRIGRTGRAGAKGESLTLVTPEENYLMRNIERFLARKFGGDSSAEAPRGYGRRNNGGGNRRSGGSFGGARSGGGGPRRGGFGGGGGGSGGSRGGRFNRSRPNRSAE